MVDETIRLTVRNYVNKAREAGIEIQNAVVFGSHARGVAGPWSDIDLVVISPDLERGPIRPIVRKLWALRAVTDSRIEPIACGPREWADNKRRLILDIAHQEGVEIL